MGRFGIAAGLLVLAGLSAPALADPIATATQCRAAAYANRQATVKTCRPNPRDPRVMQNCIARADGTYERALQRCQQALDQALRRAPRS